MNYELTHEIKGGAIVVRATGKFDRDTGAAVETLLSENAGDPRVLVMEGVEYISSSGIASLVKLTAHKKLRLAGIPQNIHHTLSLAGIERILSIHADEAQALDA